MRYLVVSDIHGSGLSADIIKELFQKENCDVLVCLGDMLYHGPRNDLPEQYNPKHTIQVLNEFKDKIIAIKGNCEAEVDGMVLNFPILDSYYLDINNRTYYLCHGHHLGFNDDDGSILADAYILHGHYHIPYVKVCGSHTYVNVGSITLPKQNNPKTYGVLTKEGLTIKDLNGNILFEV